MLVYSSGELEEVFDAKLSARVWQLINVKNSGWVTQSGMSLNQVGFFFLCIQIFSVQLENAIFMV